MSAPAGGGEVGFRSSAGGVAGVTAGTRGELVVASSVAATRAVPPGVAGLATRRAEPCARPLAVGVSLLSRDATPVAGAGAIVRTCSVV
jgi:RNA 3'-terminal phosphate cyclase